MIATSLCGGCANGAFSTASHGLGPCPPLKSYTAEFVAALADELATLAHRSAITEAIADYVVLRDQIRVCRAAFVPGGS